METRSAVGTVNPAQALQRGPRDAMIRASGLALQTALAAAAHGRGPFSASCSGSSWPSSWPRYQTVVVHVTAQPGRVFKEGTAIADGFISGCSSKPRFCGSEEDHRHR
jgi:hypothetical protein